jgi:hypothetical protein
MSTASSRDNAPLRPRDLADWLDQWALRREKVLHLIDIQGARECRHLAARCRALGHAEATQPASWWRREWASLRLEIASFLAQRASPPSARTHSDVAPRRRDDLTR